MALLIATELMTLLFAMDILSSVRSFVHGEGLWSKAQKNAVQALHRYVATRDREYYYEFHRHLEINMGDRAGRLELEKPNPDLNKVRQGFLRGGNHPEDIDGLIRLLQRFYWVDYIETAVGHWREADRQLDEVIAAAETIHQAIQSDALSQEEVTKAMTALDRLNERLTQVEIAFSESLGAGSRWLEGVLMILLMLAVLTVESTGLLLTVFFSRNLSRSLTELTHASAEIGKGNFDLKVPVRSADELGQLAESINRMSEDLKNSTGQRVRAESASQSKTRFLANMSHEIRTPIGIILGLTDVLKDPKISWEDHQKFLATIERTGRNLTRIINDILDISKVEAGHIDIEISRFEFPDFIAETHSMLAVRARITENELLFHPVGSVPVEVVTDRERLRQILVNLINNALKFTHKGRVDVFYQVSGSHLLFEVHDTGRGIQHEDRERVFKAFERAAGTFAKLEEGTGLGLMLSKKLAQALGGDVELLASEVGFGSSFKASVLCEEVCLKRAKVLDFPEREGPKCEPLKGRRALVVEDAEDNQLLVKLYLTRMGIDVEFAQNGQEGIERVMSERFDVILMDMQMPVKDGYRATAELRSKGFQGPIIAITAHAMKGDKERCLSAGCSDYLTKPLDAGALMSTLTRHVNA